MEWHMELKLEGDITAKSFKLMQIGNLLIPKL